MTDCSPDITNATIIGAGGYGIVLLLPNKQRAIKLFYDIDAHESIRKEAEIQQRVYELFTSHNSAVRVPRIYRVFNHPVIFQNVTYLCGIEMEYLEPPSGFTVQLHILLGYNGDDIDTEWGRTVSAPVSPSNPTRGFFASPETLEMVWRDESSRVGNSINLLSASKSFRLKRCRETAQRRTSVEALPLTEFHCVSLKSLDGSTMTVEHLAYVMGAGLRLMIDNGIVPADVEWVWSNGHPYIIDFGLCRIGMVNADEFLTKKGLYGLADDFYIPHQGYRGYREFLQGFN